MRRFVHVEAPPEVIADVALRIEAGAAYTVTPLGVLTLAGPQACVLFTLARGRDEARVGLEPADAALIARMCRDEGLDDDALAIETAIHSARRILRGEAMLSGTVDGWHGVGLRAPPEPAPGNVIPLRPRDTLPLPARHPGAGRG